MERLGLFIKNERLKRDVSLRKLSRDTNITPSYISHLENGNIKTPSEDHVIKIFKALDIEPNFLVYYGYAEGDLDPDFIKKQINRKSEKGELQKLIRKEINDMDREQLEATLMLITKHKDLMLNVYKMDIRSERLPITIMNQLSKFFQSEYAKM
jgi:transcriptional regulator with XRE-family HTH domain